MQVDVEKVRSKTCQNLQQVEEVAGQIIGMQLVTLKLLQKVKVHKVLVAEDVYYLVKVKLRILRICFIE
jgi:hypothetical protein